MPGDYCMETPEHEERPVADHAAEGRRPPLEEGPPPPRKKKGLGCGAWALIAAAVVFCGLAAIFVLGLLGALVGQDGISITEPTSAARRFTERTIEGKGRNKILLIPISGVITDLPRKTFGRTELGMASAIGDMLTIAREDPDIRAVILAIDSPGGGITASDVLYHKLTKFRQESGLPVIAMLGDVAASGGYYVAAASDRIVAYPTTVTGSIGVMMPLINFQGLMLKLGIESRPVKSGEKKDMGSAYRDLSDSERAMLQTIVDEYHQRFVSVVYTGFQLRKVNIPREELEKRCDGSVFTGKQAKEYGFVDEIGYFEDALDAARQKAGVSAADSRVVTYQRKPGLLDLILARASAPRADALALRIEGITNSDTPRFLYMWRVGGQF